MEELQLTLTPARVDQRNAGVMFSNWRVGQTLTALVADKLPNGNTVLSMAGQTFVTSRDIPSQPGSKVNLEVQQISPSLILKLTPSEFLQSRQVSLNAVLDGSIKPTPIGADGSLATFLRGLLVDTSRSGLFNNNALRPVFNLLMANVLRSSDVNAAVLHRLFVLGGVFTEAHWSAGKTALAANSTKSILLKLRRVMLEIRDVSVASEKQFDLSKALINIEALLSSITSKQLTSTPDQSGAQKWHTTLPVQLKESYFDLEIEVWKNLKTLGDVDSDWEVRLSMDLPELGEVVILISLSSTAVNTQVFCEEKVKNQVEERAADLHMSMLGAGLRVGTISVAGSDKLKSMPPVVQNSILDTFA